MTFAVTMQLLTVAPYAGAWIETCRGSHSPGRSGSRPTRARGLKLPVIRVSAPQHQVAPYAGAWIETAPC